MKGIVHPHKENCSCFRCSGVAWNKGLKIDKLLFPTFGHHTPHTESTKKMISSAKAGQPAWNKGKMGTFKHTEEFKKKISDLMKGSKYGLGRNLSTETIEKMKLSAKRGVDNPNWKGGTQTKDKMERVRFRKNVQKIILERDNYTCQLCHERGVDLQVDHIQSWSDYPDLRFELENCRTLCVRCHYKLTFKRPMPETIKAWGHHLLKGGDSYFCN